MITARRSHVHDWSWLYIAAFALVAFASYSFEKEIEINQLVLPIDYN